MPTTAPRVLVCLLATLLTTSVANAACDAEVAKAKGIAAEDVAPAYQALVKCDKGKAKEHFGDFMRGATDVDALVALTLVALDAGIQEPVLSVPEKVPDYSARDQTARAVGAACGDHPQVVSLIQKAHETMSDRKFGMWREALGACTADAYVQWLHGVVGEPPARPYDEKYNALSEALVRVAGLDALPTLEGAAIQAAKTDGPFTTLMDRMQEAARPKDFGSDMSAETVEKLGGVLLRVASGAAPDKARIAADRLYQLGLEEKAASLLPVVYPDRVQPGGGLLYGVAAVEKCDGAVVIHHAAVREPAKRWSIQDGVTGPARAFKGRLKCDSGEWPVLVSPEPLRDEAAVVPWVEQVVTPQVKDEGEVKLREEKAISLN